MEPDFSSLSSATSGIQELLHLLSRRRFLALGTGAFAATIALSTLKANAQEASTLLAMATPNPSFTNAAMVDITPISPDYFIPNRFQGSVRNNPTG